MSLVVSDTTPLNYLILAGHIDVLPRLFGKLLVPPAVIHEPKSGDGRSTEGTKGHGRREFGKFVRSPIR